MMWSSLIDAIRTEYNTLYIRSRTDHPFDMAASLLNSAYAVKHHRNPPIKSPCLGKYLEHNLRIPTSTCLNNSTVTLQGWPSRGGIIVLEDATPPDFAFLKLDPLDPPLRRDVDQDAEDAFCRALLLLSAMWWDGEARRKFIGHLEYGDEEAHYKVEVDGR
jgi:hypothetical protein